jgi:hypothetical protein
MNIDTIFGYIAGLLTALIILLVKHFLGKSQALGIQKKNRKHIACDKFRRVISEEISLWHQLGDSTDAKSVIGSLNKHIPILQNSSIVAAVTEFRPFVGKLVLYYDKIHNAYENHKKNAANQPFIGSPCCSKAIDFLKSLIQFAEE